MCYMESIYVEHEERWFPGELIRLSIGYTNQDTDTQTNEQTTVTWVCMRASG